MYRRALVATFSLVVAVSAANPAAAQSVLRPTPQPIVTAENEPWYLSGEPITYAGNLYYPAGAQVFFNPNEMVRSGFHMGVPLYTRTTIEPFSVVYVPLAGGRMQPYERPRAGELAGTSGSRPPAAATPYEPAPDGPVTAQAPGPPSLTPLLAPFGQEPVTARSPDIPSIERAAPAQPQAPRPVAPSTRRPPDVPRAVGTSGRAVPSAQPTHTRIGGRPQGINAIFVEFRGQRWYSAGRAQPIDRTRMERVGEYHGFDVWSERGGDGAQIYLAVTQGGSLVVPYSRTKPRD